MLGSDSLFRILGSLNKLFVVDFLNKELMYKKFISY